jgi:hypothetical protein
MSKIDTIKVGRVYVESKTGKKFKILGWIGQKRNPGAVLQEVKVKGEYVGNSQIGYTAVRTRRVSTRLTRKHLNDIVDHFRELQEGDLE